MEFSGWGASREHHAVQAPRRVCTTLCNGNVTATLQMRANNGFHLSNTARLKPTILVPACVHNARFCCGKQLRPEAGQAIHGGATASAPATRVAGVGLRWRRHLVKADNNQLVRVRGKGDGCLGGACGKGNRPPVHGRR